MIGWGRRESGAGAGRNQTHDMETRPTRGRVVYGTPYNAAAASQESRKLTTIGAPVPRHGVGELVAPQVAGGQPDPPE